ncbi:hypothetical protein [Psychroserpens damuponensis]|uniref:hypothetical protein n=1 Tax=Psychroserpens damuponensis TaxID=943936 RepID=UPI00058FB830|nr:hypothetical protein [Psychroserpens damuponensis]
MKNYLLIILISVYSSSFSQVQIDTSDIKLIRFEWKINNKEKDTTLRTILTEYRSGFFKLKWNLSDDINSSTDYSPTFISKGIIKNEIGNDEIENRDSRIFITESSNGILKTYYDNYQNPDSIVILNYKPVFKKSKFIVQKEYKRKGKLKYISEDLNGRKNYKYNLFGKLRTVEHYNTDSTLYKISHYKKDLLILETKPKYQSEITYEYNKNNKLIKSSGSYAVTEYEYNEHGLKKIEKFSRKNNVVMNYTLYFYKENGTLERKKEFGENDILINEFIYEYK